MANLIVTLISIAVILSGVSLTAQGTFKSMGNLSDDWKQMEVRSGNISRTGLEVLDANRAGAQVDITLENSGQTSLQDWAAWDVLVEYYDDSSIYHQLWLPYTTESTPGDNQWTVLGIYEDAGPSKPEVFQPGMFDPGEEMVVRMRLEPRPKNSATHHAVVGTPNGVTVSTDFY